MLRNSSAHPTRVAGSSSLILIAAIALAVVGLLSLFFVDPARASFYPGSANHRLTGLLCPGCGGLRATHQLLHGEWAEAFRLNPAWVISLPLLAGFGGLTAWRRLRGQPAPAIGVGSILAGVAIAIAFGVIRNLGHG